MGKCVDRGYIPYAEITICDGCFHKDVCGDRDYLTENKCSAKAGGCWCGECHHSSYDAEYNKRWCNRDLGCREVKADGSGFCDLGVPREGQDDG